MNLFRLYSCQFQCPQSGASWAWPLINLTIVVAGALVIGIPRYLAPADSRRQSHQDGQVNLSIMAIEGLALCIGYLAYHIWVLPAMLVVCATAWILVCQLPLLIGAFCVDAILISGLLLGRIPLRLGIIPQR
jgi:hypothetical protein